MSIVFDQVEGVVQKKEGGANTPTPVSGDTKQEKPAAESHAHHQRMHEHRTRRLRAD